MNKKKLLALLMALVMTLSLVPVTAFADGKVARVDGGEEYATLQDAIDNAESGSTIELLANIYEECVTIREGQNITLNLNDHSVTYNDTPIIVYGKLTVEDVENDQIGSITSNKNCGIAVRSGGELVFNGGEVTAQEMAVLFSGPNAKGTINGGSFTALDNAVFGTNGSTGRGGNVIYINDGVFFGGIQTEGYVACGIYAANDDIWNVNGGYFSISGGAGIVARAGVVNVGGDVTISTSGQVTGRVGDSPVPVPCSAIVFDSQADYPGLDDSSIINISGGNFLSYDTDENDSNPVATVNEVKAETADSHISISGGEFFSDPGDSFIADGYAAVKKHDEDFDEDYWTVVSAFVAQNDDVKYKTLAAAVAEAQSGDTIELIADTYELSDGSELTIDKSVTITGAVDGDGNPLYTIYGKNTATGTNDIFISGSGEVTLSNLKIQEFGCNTSTDPAHAPVYVSTNFTGTVNFTNLYISQFNRGGMFLYGGSFTVEDCYIDCANSRSGAFTKGIEIKDSANGTISNTLICNMERSSDAASTAGIEIYGYGSVEVNDCTILSDVDDHTAAKATYGIVSSRVGEHDPSGGSLVVNNTLTETTNAAISVADSDEYGPVNNYSITVNECDFDNYIATWSATSSITINSGSFAQDVYAGAGTINIQGGEFTYFAPDTDTGSIIITGGIFDTNPTDPTNYVSAGYKAVYDDYCVTWTVVPNGAVAKIGDTGYTTLEDAFAAAEDGDTIELLGNCSGDGIVVPQGKFNEQGLTVRFNGYTYTVDGETVGSTGTETNGFQLLKDNKISFQDGTITGNSRTNTSTLVILIQNYSDLTLNNMTLSLVGKYYGQYTLSNNNGTIVIDGSTINAPDYSWANLSASNVRSFAFDVCRFSSYPSVSVTVQGYSTINGDIQIDAYDRDPKEGFTLDLYDCMLDGKIVLTDNAKAAMAANPGNPGKISKLYGYDFAAPEGCYWADGDTLVYSDTDVAVIESASFEYESYGTLEEAFAAAQDGDTISLLRDVALTSTVSADLGNNAVTLDLAGHNITATNARALHVKSGEVNITGSGTISATATGGSGFDSSSSVIRVGDSDANSPAATLTVDEDVTVSSNHCYGITAFGKNADITLIVDGTVSVTGTQAAISGNGSKGLSATTMTINGSVSATQDYAIYHPGMGTLTVNGTVTGKGGIEAKGGTVTINQGATVVATATANELSHDMNNNGTSTSGYAIAAVENGNYQGDAAVEINGGFITGSIVVIVDSDASSWNPSITITGGIFDHNPSEYVAVNYVVDYDNSSKTWTVVPNGAVALIGGKGYTSLADAFDAAQDGQTITLLDNVNLTSTVSADLGDMAVTLDLAGHNITAADARALHVQSGDVAITGTGTVSASGDSLSADSSVIRVGNSAANAAAASLTIGENVTVSSDKSYGVTAFGLNEDGIELTVNGKVSVSSARPAIGTSGNGGQATPTITINSGAVVENTNTNGTTKSENLGVYLPAGNMTVKDGASVSGHTAIYAKAGCLTIEGGTISGTGASAPYEYYGNGGYATGDAIVIDSCNYPNGAPTANIKGATITSANGKQVGYYEALGSGNKLTSGHVYADQAYTLSTNVVKGWVEYDGEYAKTIGTVSPVAQIGEVQYPTLESAVDAAQNDGIITLLADIDLAVDPLTDGGYANVAPENKTITLDLNNHAISGGALDVYGTLTIIGTGSVTGVKHGIWVNEGATLNVQGGTINGGTGMGIRVDNGTLAIAGGTVNADVGYAVYANSGTVTISGGAVTNSTGAGAVYVNNGSLTMTAGTVTSTNDDTDAICIAGTTTATISGGTVSGHDWGVTVFGTSQLTVSGNAIIGTDDDEGYAISTNGNAGQNATVTINGGTITGTELGIYQPSGKLTVTGGTITGATGIYFKSNSLNITGGTIVGNGANVAYNYNGNGANPTGDALVIDSCGYPNGINDVSVSGGNFNSDHAKAVACYTYKQNAPVINFITGGKYSSEPDSSYVADGYKAAGISDGSYKFQVGVVTVTPTTEGSIDDNSGSVIFQVTTTVEEHKGSTNDPLESYTNLSVTVSGTSDEVVSEGNAATAVAALTNIKDNDTLNEIVSSAIEAAGAKITSETQQANVTIQLAKSAADTTTESGKVTYEVHPEAIIQVGDETVGTVALNNSQIKGSFTFMLYAGNIPGGVEGKKILVTHTHDDGTTEDHGPYTVDDAGYITLEGITSFSDFTLEAIEEDTTVWAKYSYSLTLEDSIKINFKVKDLQGEPGDYTVAYGFGEDKDNSWTEVKLDSKTLNSFEIGSFAAKEMGKEVHVIVYHDSDIIKDAKYSVKKYCDTVINGNYGAEITALCKATLDYGRYAQEAFNYETGALVNGGNDYFTNSNIVVPAATSTKTPNGYYVTGVSLSLITTAETQLVARFKTPVRPTDVTIDGNPVNSWIYVDGVVKVTATGISASDLDENVTFVVTDDDGGSYIYTVSPTYYMYLAISKNSQVSLNRAFYNYYLKAEAYFATKNK